MWSRYLVSNQKPPFKQNFANNWKPRLDPENQRDLDSNGKKSHRKTTRTQDRRGVITSVCVLTPF